MIIMKIVKNSQYDYEKNSINENTGYTKWYDSGSVAGLSIGAVVVYCIILLIVLHVFEDVIIQNFEVPQNGFSGILYFCGTLIMIFVIPVVWKWLQFLIASKGKLGQECILNLKNPAASVYEETINRKTAVVCLIVPGVLYILVFLLLTILTHGVPKTFFLLMLFRVFMCTVDDIGNLWCLMRNVGKNDVVFGEYKKHMDM